MAASIHGKCHWLGYFLHRLLLLAWALAADGRCPMNVAAVSRRLLLQLAQLRRFFARLYSSQRVSFCRCLSLCAMSMCTHIHTHTYTKADIYWGWLPGSKINEHKDRIERRRWELQKLRQRRGRRRPPLHSVTAIDWVEERHWANWTMTERRGKRATRSWVADRARERERENEQASQLANESTEWRRLNVCGCSWQPRLPPICSAALSPGGPKERPHYCQQVHGKCKKELLPLELSVSEYFEHREHLFENQQQTHASSGDLSFFPNFIENSARHVGVTWWSVGTSTVIICCPRQAPTTVDHLCVRQWQWRKEESTTVKTALEGRELSMICPSFLCRGLAGELVCSKWDLPGRHCSLQLTLQFTLSLADWTTWQATCLSFCFEVADMNSQVVEVVRCTYALALLEGRHFYKFNKIFF